MRAPLRSKQRSARASDALSREIELSPRVDAFLEMLVAERGVARLTREAYATDLKDLARGHGDFDIAAFERRLRAQHLVPIGVQGGSQQQHEAAIAAGLSVVPPGKTRLRAIELAVAASREDSKREAPPLPLPESAASGSSSTYRLSRANRFAASARNDWPCDCWCSGTPP